MERTRGVFLISVYFFFFGFILATMCAWGLRDLAFWGLLQPLDATLLTMLLLAGLTCSVAAIGLFQLRNWGRRFIMFFALVKIIVGLAAFLVPMDLLSSSLVISLLSYKFPRFNIAGGVLSIALGLITLWYLSKPKVKFLFWW